MTQLAEEVRNPTNAEISEISALAQVQLEREKQIKLIEEQLSLAKEALRKVKEVDLPAAMAQAGVSAITLPTGQKVSVKEDVYASIPKGNVEEALQWLRDHDLGDVIKNEVVVSFGKGQEDKASRLIVLLHQERMEQFSVTCGVHPATLKSLIKELLAMGEDVPMDLFGAHPVAVAVVK